MSHSLIPTDAKGKDLVLFDDPKHLLKPLQQVIYLDSVYIAGIRYLDSQDPVEALKKDDILLLEREPENPADPLAVKVTDRNGCKLGYIPRKSNVVYARLMDAGKMIQAKVVKKKEQQTFHAVKIALSLVDF